MIIFLGGASSTPKLLPLTIDMLLKKGKVTSDQLKQELEGEDLLSLAKYFDKPCSYAVLFGLNEAEKEDVKAISRHDIHDAMHKVLVVWQRVNPMEATLENLLNVVLSQRRGDIALNICKHLQYGKV